MQQKPFQLSVNNAIYGYGAAIVIIGALMKITYFSPTWFPEIANTMLTVGLVIEALIFAYSAIDPSLQKEDYEWERVYPILRGKKDGPVGDPTSPEALMSKHIEQMFKNISWTKKLSKDYLKAFEILSFCKIWSDNAVKINKEFANNANELTNYSIFKPKTLNNVYEVF